MDIFTLNDMILALQNAQPGDVLLFNIKNDIAFTSAIIINKSVSIEFVNDTGNETVSLNIVNAGSFRHVTTPGISINNITILVNNGIILNGAGTGGGIQLFGSNNLLTLDNCTVSNCKATGNGGGILMQGNTSRSHVVMDQVLIEGCRAGSGGAVFSSACDIEINDGNIIDNFANTSGGGITTIAGGNMLGCTLTITGGRISANSALPFGDGGGLNCFDTIVTIDGAEISNNSADSNGGGINTFNQTGNASLNALIIKNSTIESNTVRNFGGGIRTENALSEFTISNSVISGNQAITPGGSNQGGGIYDASASTLTFNASEIIDNQAGSGAGMFINFSTVFINENTVISGNVATFSGGGIFGFEGTTITIEENSRVENNLALCGNDPQDETNGGGGIALLSSDFISTLNVINGAVIANNTSVSYGGGIFTFPLFTPENIVNISNATITENKANFGGGISMGAIPGFTPVLSIVNSVISENTASTDGGGIFATGSLVTINGTQIINNTAGRDGGGIFTDILANVTVNATSIFHGNFASRYAFWTITNGGDSDIYKTHIFTTRFSSFIPSQTPPALVWDFTNAYNNYDIDYVREPVITVTVNFDVDATDVAVHSTFIDSFLGATVTIPSRNSFFDSEGNEWFLDPPNQPAQTLVLTDPNADYVVTFSFEPEETDITVTEEYIDTCGIQIMTPTQTIITSGDNYSKNAPEIPCYRFLSFRMNNGPLQSGQVIINAIRSDTLITFIYTFDCNWLRRAVNFGKLYADCQRIIKFQFSEGKIV